MLKLSVVLTMSLALSWAMLEQGQRELWALELGL